ncbi:MAG TPA: stimulus-sensing domain-containing protein [Alphaproteobacteria bacterium]|nr:stimulus-sensing domain-containing protein [Alphaproteobacteria bacterium]
MAIRAPRRELMGQREPPPLARHRAPPRETKPATGRAPVEVKRRRRRVSPLTRRILFVNSIPLLLLVAGLLYLDDYRRSLIDAQFRAMATQGEMIAAAIGEAATDVNDEEVGARLTIETARTILRRLVEPTNAHARLFAASGEIVADSRVLGVPGGQVVIEVLPPPGPPPGPLAELANTVYDLVVNWLPRRTDLPRYREILSPRVEDYEEARLALSGETEVRLRAGSGYDVVLSVAVPVQRFKQVLGVLMLTSDSASIDRALRSLRFDILKMFVLALGVTFLLSIYLAGTIARPLRRLAVAAERVRRGHGLGAGRMGSLTSGAQPVIPDMSRRGDEIGELSGALKEMTEALWQRLDAIERFAADVSHEIKNPLTSLKSAIETASRVKDPAQQQRLMSIVLEDIARIDRLIGDISSASRLDAELSRAEAQPIDVASMLQALVEMHAATVNDGGPRIELDVGSRALIVPGLEDRLGQVFRNIIANAASFSPPGGTIRISARQRKDPARGETVEITFDDEGPGIPEDKREAIFERFYSERPKGEKFGTHSGLGLSISRQIVNAHGGTISAENRRDASGKVLGARFIVRLPVE